MAKVKKSKKIYWLISLIALILLITLINQYLKNDVNYQFMKLERGNAEGKVLAADFMGENRVITAIPILVGYIDSKEFYLYKGKAVYSVSCASQRALIEITGKNFGDTCITDDSSFDMTDAESQKIRNDWKDWYKNEYPKWLENYQKK